MPIQHLALALGGCYDERAAAWVENEAHGFLRTALEVVEDEGLEVGEGGHLLSVQMYSTVPRRFQCAAI